MPSHEVTCRMLATIQRRQALARIGCGKTNPNASIIVNGASRRTDAVSCLGAGCHRCQPGSAGDIPHSWDDPEPSAPARFEADHALPSASEPVPNPVQAPGNARGSPLTSGGIGTGPEPAPPGLKNLATPFDTILGCDGHRPASAVVAIPALAKHGITVEAEWFSPR